MILRLNPIFKERIWGGTRLKTLFEYPIPNDQTGECWGISGHANGSNLIINGPYQGFTLRDLYKKHPHLFKHAHTLEFPLLTKIIDAQDDLSVQVHPSDNDVIGTVETSGKTECWYVLDAEKGSSIILGHHALTKKDFIDAIDKNQWNDVLREIQVQKGDFIYVPAGTVHAIKKGLLILETQQSSDTTFRLYDYQRKDTSGNARELHIDEALNVMTIPGQNETIHHFPDRHKGNSMEQLISNSFFTVEKWIVRSEMTQLIDGFKLFSIIEGKGTLNQDPIKKGDHFIVTGEHELIELNGDFESIISWV